MYRFMTFVIKWHAQHVQKFIDSIGGGPDNDFQN